MFLSISSFILGEDKSSLSVFFQLPQNILMGFSELFAMVASYEFAYFAAPRSAQSLFMSLRFSAAGAASFISTAYSSYLLNPADADPNSNVSATIEHRSCTFCCIFFRYFQCLGQKESWRYHTYFFILAGFQLIFIFVLLLCHKKFRIFQLNPPQTKTNQFLYRPSAASSIRF